MRTAAVRRLLLHKRTQMAVKAAAAAALSWAAAEAVTRTVPGQALENYTYYAPLGAVVATYPTVAASLRSAVQAALALVLGGTLGLVVHETLPESVFTLALVVGVGVALGALPGLGEQRSWVPIVALFVLVVGAGNTLAYAAAYVGLTGLGALCGVLVSLLLPATRLTQGREAIHRLQRVLADQLEDVADGMRSPDPLGAEGWRRRRHRLSPVLDDARSAVRESQEAGRGNPRARFHAAELRRQLEVERALERAAVLVEDLLDVLVESYSDDLLSSPLDAELGSATADALDRLARLVRVYDVDLPAGDPRVREAVEALRALTEEFGRRRDLDPADVAVIGAVVANLRRSIAAVAPRRRDEQER